MGIYGVFLIMGNAGFVPSTVGGVMEPHSQSSLRVRQKHQGGLLIRFPPSGLGFRFRIRLPPPPPSVVLDR